MGAYKKIYILSTVSKATGGTELLHQLSDKLIDFNEEVYIYYDGEYDGSPVQKKFEFYKKKIAYFIEDNSENILIVPEVRIKELFKYKNIQKAVWWLSVDFYSGSGKRKANLIRRIVRCLRDRKVRKFDKNWIHFVQSEYARLYLLRERAIPERNIFHLSDYISNTFLERVNNYEGKRNVVLYNPQKGYEFTKILIDRSPDIEWTPLINMTSEQMKKTMLAAKIYIDFGNHPGKDRIPREAALCGCCIITGKRGAAANDIDIKIPHKYKFDDDVKQIDNIRKKIIECFENYEECREDFVDYVGKIMKEEKEFSEDIINFFVE